MDTKQTRRKFLRDLIKISGAALGLFTFGKFFTLSANSFTDSNSVEKPEPKNGERDKILVAYESQFGSTAEIAKFIGSNLPGHNKVNILRISEIENLSEYNQIIIGSAIQYDTWMKNARDFIQVNEDILAKKSVSFFLVCLVLAGNNEKTRCKANKYAAKIKKLAPKINVKNFGQFAGVLDYSKMPFATRMLLKGITAIHGLKEGDYRDWEQIKNWTKLISSRE